MTLRTQGSPGGRGTAAVDCGLLHVEKRSTLSGELRAIKLDALGT